MSGYYNYVKIDLMGYAGKAPELINQSNGTDGVKFPLAVNRAWKSGDTLQTATDWYQIVAWGNVAEHCLMKLAKGSHVFVSGRPEINRWTDERGGGHSRIQVVASVLIVPETRPDDLLEEELPAD